jgi:hypothetical protein
MGVVLLAVAMAAAMTTMMEIARCASYAVLLVTLPPVATNDLTLIFSVLEIMVLTRNVKWLWPLTVLQLLQLIQPSTPYGTWTLRQQTISLVTLIGFT